MNEIKVTKIVVTLPDGSELALTLDEARALHAALGEVVDKPVIFPPQFPIQPWQPQPYRWIDGTPYAQRSDCRPLDSGAAIRGDAVRDSDSGASARGGR